MLSRQIANTLVAAKLEAAGSFVFVVDAEPQPVDFITVDTQSVLLDISALGGEYCLAVEMLGQPSTVLVRNGDYNTLPRNPLLMGRDEFAVLLQVDGSRTVKEITQASHLEEITVVSILGKLADAGVLLVKAERQSRAEDAGGAPGAPRQRVGGGQPPARRHGRGAGRRRRGGRLRRRRRTGCRRSCSDGPGGARTTKGAGGPMAARPFCVLGAGAAPGGRPLRAQLRR